MRVAGKSALSKLQLEDNLTGQAGGGGICTSTVQQTQFDTSAVAWSALTAFRAHRGCSALSCDALAGCGNGNETIVDRDAAC